MSPSCWAVVVPVKPLHRAKTRLTPALPAGLRHLRADLALAMAADTVAAAMACPRVAAVLVVTDDDRAARTLRSLGASVIADVAGGLNAALEYGAERAVGQAGSCGVAALAAHLPALRPATLTAALDAAAEHPRAFVADAAGAGTTLLSAAAGVALRPEFGTGSRDRHLRSGAAELRGDGLDGLRCDVDTAADLAHAGALGVGPRTAELLHLLVPAGGAPYGPVMQATVSAFSPSDGSGSVLLDDGTPLRFSAEAFARSGLRALRPGQRVRLRLEGTGEQRRVTFLTLVTLPG